MSGAEILGLIVEVVGLAKKAWDVAEKATHTKQTIERLLSSKKSLERANECFESLPYKSLLTYIRNELQSDNNPEGHHLRYVFEWVQGRIDEIKELEKVIQDTLQVLTAINSHGAAKTTTEVQKILEKIKQGTDISYFFDVVNKICMGLGRSPRDILEKNPQQILAKIERSTPAWVLKESSVEQWMKDDALSRNHRQPTNPSLPGSAGRHVLPIYGAAIYYCNYESRESQVPERIVLTLLHQLITQLWEVAPHRAYPHLGAVRNLTTFQGTQQGVQDVFRVLSTVAGSFDRLYITIDALDELPTSNLATLLQRLCGLALPGVKFFVTSRDGSRVLQTARTVNANQNASTMRAFVQEKLRSIAENRDPNVAWPIPQTDMLGSDDFSRQVEERTLELSRENFFCADLMIRQLLDCQEEDEVHQSLSNLSRTVDGLITQAIDRIKAQDSTQAARGSAALLWVIYTRGSSIHFTELQHTLAFQFYGDNPAATPGSHVIEFSRPKLTKFTCRFLSFGGDSESISVHKAVQDFCVKEGMDKMQPFLRYAASNWGWHMAAGSQAAPDCPPPNMDLMELLRDDPFLDVVTVAIQPRLKELGIWTSDMWEKLKTKKSPISALDILAFFDLDRVVVRWLAQWNKGPEDDDSQPILSSALYLAAIQGSHRTVLVLLSKGADPLRKHGESGMTALRGACQHDHADVVEALFRNTPDELCVKMVAQKNAHNQTPLSDAYLNVETMRRMLNVMGQMDESAAQELLLLDQFMWGGTVMYAAAEADNGDVIVELLDFRPGETPLHRAAKMGSATAIQRLLDRGADPNALNKEGNTATMLAALQVANLTGRCRPAGDHFLCIEYLLPLMGRDLLSETDAQELQRVLMKHNQPKAFSLLLNEFPDQWALMMDKRSTLLNKAISHGHLPIVEAIITIYGKSDLKVRNPEGLTLLMRTAQLGFSNIVRYLLDNGTDICALGDSDRSTLEWCAELSNADIVAAIWQHDPELLKPGVNNDKIMNMVSARNQMQKNRAKSEVKLVRAPTLSRIPSQRWPRYHYRDLRSRYHHRIKADKGSIRGSETWLDIAVKRGGEIIRQIEFTHNKLNVNKWTVYRDTWEVDNG
ncbi:hypothetical protein F5Y09DRAFT_335151 [Xylaria sp. FL1042]|nr:hypothetical protein F5Y09DRAFT_335151 [Xylaria sp. FL1042]